MRQIYIQAYIKYSRALFTFYISYYLYLSHVYLL